VNRDARGRFARREAPAINRPTLVKIAQIEACRAGIGLRDLGDDVELHDHRREMVERLPLAEACVVLALLRGRWCSPHILRAGGLRLVCE